MTKSYSYLFAFLISLAIISCNSKQAESTGETKKETNAFDKQWAKSFIDSIGSKILAEFKAGDSVALASRYWPDAEFLQQNSEALKGNQILSAWGSMTRMIKDFRFSTTDIVGGSEFLIETGTYEVKDEKKALIDKGKYVVVWQQRNGEWKIYRDIGNTSLPAPK